MATGYNGPPAYIPWRPPLQNPTAVNNLIAATTRHHLEIPMGIIDLPYHHKQLPWMVNLTGTTASAAIGGAKQHGKTTFCETLIVSTAATHAPTDAQFFCLDFSASRLVQLEALPHVAGVATRTDVPRIRRTVAELKAIRDRRQTLFTTHRIPGWNTYRQLRTTNPDHPAAQDPYGDIVFIIDGWDVFSTDTWLPDQLKPDHDKFFLPTVEDLLNTGPDHGIHTVITCTRWQSLRGKFRDNLPLKIDLHQADENDAGTDIRIARTVPDKPGRAISTEKQHIMIAAPRLDGQNTIAGIEDTYKHTIATIATQWSGHPTPPKLAVLPAQHPIRQLLDANPTQPTDPRTTRWKIPIGIAESTVGTAILDLAEQPHLLVFGEPGSGKTTAARAIATAITQRNTPQQVIFMIVDFRGGLKGAVPDDYMMVSPRTPFYVRNPKELTQAVQDLEAGLSNPARRTQGRDIVVLVDNWHQVLTADPMAMQGLTDAIMTPESGLHLIATCLASHMTPATNGTRSATGSAWSVGAHALLLSGDKENYYTRAFSFTKRPPGQALYINNSAPRDVIQIGYEPPPEN
nr:type VII secretion protein EccCb [Mycobacterium talmoniae]